MRLALFSIPRANPTVALACLALLAPILAWTAVEPIVEGKIVTVFGEVSPDLGRYAELRGSIEYLACTHGGKLYEALLLLHVVPSALREALLATGVEPGSPVSVDASGNMVPPSGPGVTLTVAWKDPDGRSVRVRAEDLILDVKTQRPMKRIEWIFTGSRLLEDPSTGRAALQADLTGNIVSTHQADRSVLLQNPLAEAIDESRYQPNEALLPAQGTPMELSFDVSEAIARRLFIRGTVQGVGFRAFALSAAERLGVLGTVRNLLDGRVEVLAEGRPTIVHELVRRLRHGPPLSSVDDVETEEVPASGKYGDFQILY